MNDTTPGQGPGTIEAPSGWSVFNTSTEVAGGLTLAEALDYLTPERLQRGWSVVCVINKDNPPKVAAPAPVAQPKPVKYEARRKNRFKPDQWSEWSECPADFADTVRAESIPDEWEIRALYTAAPAPVLTPLSPKVVKAIMTEAGYDHATAQARADFISGLRHGERAHGITGRPAAPVLTPAQQHADELVEALRDALSVCTSVSMSRDRRVVRDDCTMYAQLEEWCQWAEGEVQQKLRAVLAKIEATGQEGGKV